MTRPPLPPFTREAAIQKVRLAEDGWNSRDPEKVALLGIYHCGHTFPFEFSLQSSHSVPHEQVSICGAVVAADS